ncbi:MAG: hypothetical protein P9L91_07635 [Candidatus Zophobacter franzmannii]|nr:hypothetical protein [Candidatus Zophobacter franzmannii]
MKELKCQTYFIRNSNAMNGNHYLSSALNLSLSLHKPNGRLRSFA